MLVYFPAIVNVFSDSKVESAEKAVDASCDEGVQTVECILLFLWSLFDASGDWSS